MVMSFFMNQVRSDNNVVVAVRNSQSVETYAESQPVYADC
jgi:hypothetical protein